MNQQDQGAQNLHPNTSNRQNVTLQFLIIQFLIVLGFSIVSSLIVTFGFNTEWGFLFVGVITFFWGANTLFITSKLSPQTTTIYRYEQHDINQGLFYFIDGILLILVGVIYIIL